MQSILGHKSTCMAIECSWWFSSLCDASLDLAVDFFLHVVSPTPQLVKLLMDEHFDFPLVLLDRLDSVIQVLVALFKLGCLPLNEFLELLRLLVELILDQFSH